MVQGSGSAFMFQGSGLAFMVQGSGLAFMIRGFSFNGSGLRVWTFMVQRSGLRAHDSVSSVQGERSVRGERVKG